MQLTDIKSENQFVVWVGIDSLKTNLERECLETGSLGTLLYDNGDTYKIKINDEYYIFSPLNKNFSDIDSQLKRGCANLVEIINMANNGSVELKIIFFNGALLEMGDIEVGIDEKIQDTAKKKGLRFHNIETLNKELSKRFTLHVNNDVYFLMLIGQASEEDFLYLESDSTEYEDIEEEKRAFSLYGNDVKMPVELRRLDIVSEVLFANKLIVSEHTSKEMAIRLVRGNIKFSDYSRTGKLQSLAAGAIERLTNQEDSYLSLWNKYSCVEGDIVLHNARDVGVITYDGIEKTTKGVKFAITEEASQSLKNNMELSLVSVIPSYLMKPDMDFNEYQQELKLATSIAKELKATPNAKNNDNKKNISNDRFKIIEVNAKSIVLDMPTLPDEQGTFILSIQGDLTQFERRMNARDAIVEGRSANPLLGLLIEEKGEIPDIQRTTKIKPLSYFVKNKIFAHEPTDKQVDAIDVALNTPDIAIIQGPPGTGKTTVVTAILERLNEESDKNKSIRGKILVSGFQHDAVENIISRLSINNLPAIKFGKSSSESEFSDDSVSRKITAWCDTITQKIRKNNILIFESEEQRKIADLRRIYINQPSNHTALNLIEQILALPRHLINTDVINKAEYMRNSLQPIKDNGNPRILRMIRSLRISEDSFNDDGSDRAFDLLIELEDTLTNKQRMILEKFTRKTVSFEQNNSLSELRDLQQTLLSTYLPKVAYLKEKPNTEILNLCKKITQQLQKSLSKNDKENTILADFLHELEDNPDGVRESIEDYSFVFSATTQQSVRHDISSAKQKFDAQSNIIQYDTVVVDEAARTSPTDLLIPMVQGKNRIILVGDHRQLPHIINEQTAKQLEADSPDVDFVKENLEKSMFEYLFKRLKKLEQQDGIKRTVTLDAQYRTHPLLGDFVSEQFYEKHNEGYRSPLASSFFQHNLPELQNKPAVWIDVPNNKGGEQKLESKSRIRMVEAEIIAEYINKWISTVEGKQLSFGVISFYKAQVNEVYKQLQKYKITEKSVDGSWCVTEMYKNLDNTHEERLRIGTVDSFQGMEFDIVFLSMVRSQSDKYLQKKTANINDTGTKIACFGHLMSKNRLCVSMSRQKKALIVVGDAHLAISDIGKTAVPELAAYHKLCMNEGVIL